MIYDRSDEYMVLWEGGVGIFVELPLFLKLEERID